MLTWLNLQLYLFSADGRKDATCSKAFFFKQHIVVFQETKKITFLCNFMEKLQRGGAGTVKPGSITAAAILQH